MRRVAAGKGAVRGTRLAFERGVPLHPDEGALLLSARAVTVIGRANPHALESFWEQADVDASDEHPLERELAERVDALLRYQVMVEAAQAEGREDVAEILLAQQHGQEVVVRVLREALRRMRGG